MGNKFRFLALYLTDGYKLGHKAMLQPGTTRLYGTWIPRSFKHAPKGIDKILSIGHQLTWKFIRDTFQEDFFERPIEEVEAFIQDMNVYLGLPYNGDHFKELHKLGYLPILVQALPEGIETPNNIPHMTFINTVDGFAWLTLFLETLISSLSWKVPTNATISLQFRRMVSEWVERTDKENAGLVDFLCHDFSARGLDPWTMMVSGLAHGSVFRGSESMAAMPAIRYYYNTDNQPFATVPASEHSCSCVKIFSVGEKQMISDWLKTFNVGILSLVSDTFDLWKLLTEYLPELKEEIMNRDGKLVIRPDSGDPVDILCGYEYEFNYHSKDDTKPTVVVKGSKGQVKILNYDEYEEFKNTPEAKGVIEILWDVFGGTVNTQGYKLLDSHVGTIYGDSINLERQKSIYERLERKGFAVTNVILGIGSYTYQYSTRDSFGFAAKGAWFECDEKEYSIYKDPITDDGTKKSLKGFQFVFEDENGVIHVESEVSEEKAYSDENMLRPIFKDGEMLNEITFETLRERITDIV